MTWVNFTPALMKKNTMGHTLLCPTELQWKDICGRFLCASVERAYKGEDV